MNYRSYLVAFLVSAELARTLYKAVLKMREVKKKNNTVYYNFSNKHPH